MTDQVMTEAATTTEGSAASQSPRTVEATADALYGGKQQAEGAQDQQARDGAPADEGAKGDETGEAKGDKPEGAPEKYEFKAPEGREFDAEVITAFSDVAKELNLSNEAAQKMLDKMAPLMESRTAQQIESVKAQWMETSMADKEFGGEKIRENLAVAKKALDQFGSPQLRELLEQSGLGNHPEMIRLMYRAGKAISEDKYVGPSQGAGAKAAPKDFGGMASALYSNQ